MSLFQPIKTIYNESVSFFLHPRSYWLGVKNGDISRFFGFKNFFLPGLVISLVFIFLGDLVFHSKNGFFWKDALVKACRRTLLLLLVHIFSVMIIRFVMQQFHVPVKMKAIRVITSFSLSPAIILMVITGLLPFLDLGGLAPWYGLFLAYTGFETFFKIPQEKKFYFYFALFMAIFSLIMILTFTFNRISAHILM